MSETHQKRIEFDEFIFETGGNILLRGGGVEVVPLEPAAARVLRYMLENAGRLVLKEEILDAVWNEVFTTEDVLKRAVSQIRRALGDDARNSRFIETYHRRGYRFIAPVRNPTAEGGRAAPEPGGQSISTPGDASAPKQQVEKLETGESENSGFPAVSAAATITTAGDPSFDCFIGRGREMSFLQAEFRRALQGAGQPVLVVGEPGIGKTQTATRFVRWAEESAAGGVVPLRLRFFDYEASFLPPYDLFLDLLGEACAAVFGPPASNQTADGGGGAPKVEKTELRRTVEKKLGIRLPGELFDHSPAPRQGVADASRAITPLAESFARLSRVRPLILVFDDVQWADETSRRIIGGLMRLAADAPLMLVGLARRVGEAGQQGPLAGWLQEQAVYRSFTVLELAPLSAEDCRSLIGEVFQGRLDTGEIPDADLVKLHKATGGNPYFLVETLRLLINENVIVKNTAGAGDPGGGGGAARWRWRGIEDIPLPETVRMAARAKLVKLSPEARDLVECAAVLGDAFQVKTLQAMLAAEGGTGGGGGLYPDELTDAFLDEVIAAQVLTEQNVSGADDCQFYHTTLRRAVYMDLSPRRRRRLHARAMRAIEDSHRGEPERFAAALAAHAENAGDFQKSLRLNLQACRAAAARFDWLEASEMIARAERAASKIPPAEMARGEENLEFLALRGEVYVSVGRRAEAEKILKQAAALADEKADARALAHILLLLGRARILLGKYREAIEPLERSLALARRSGDRFDASSALIQLASAKYALCEYEESCAMLQKVIAEEDAGSYNRAVALGKLGWTRALQSRYREAKRLLEEALEFHRTAGDMRERAVLSMCLNWCEYGTGDYEAAIGHAVRARREAQVVGEPYNESVAMMRIAKARLAQGLYRESETLLRGAWEKQKDLDAPHAQAETIWMLGRARLALGDLGAARRDLRAALDMIRGVGDRDDEFRILIDRSYLESRAGEIAGAVDLAERAAQIAEEIGVSEGVGEALAAKSGALLAGGRFDEAADAARGGATLLEEFESGERWRAHYFLASALAGKAKATAAAAASAPPAKANKKSTSLEKMSREIESALRRALTVLDFMRGQFSADDEARRAEFSRSHAAPARDLYELLLSAGRRGEAEEIRRAWPLD